MNFCPNKSHPDWKYIVENSDETTALKLYIKEGLNIPTKEKTDEYFSSVSFNLKALDVLTSNMSKVKQWESNKGINQETLYKKIQELGVPKQQLELLKESQGNTVEEKLASFAANYSYTVEINIAKESTFKQKPSGFREESEDKVQSYTDSEGNTKWQIINTEIGIIESDFSTKEDALAFIGADVTGQKPTSYYSNLTVPGGTNYTEQEIATPGITPSIKGHAQFATDQGIGWFRSDDEADKSSRRDLSDEELFNAQMQELEEGMSFSAKKQTGVFTKGTKTRRILEVQSDLFQKGRNKEDLISESNQKISLKNINDAISNPEKYWTNDMGGGYWLSDYESVEQGFDITGSTKEQFLERLKAKKQELEKSSVSKENQFLQLLNKANNWVTFFVKSIIQDSAKKGYEKVLFPSGNTASKIEGHTTLEEFKKQKEDRIKELNKAENTIIEKRDDNDMWDKPYKLIRFNTVQDSFYSKKDAEKAKNELEGYRLNEINQLKQELERVEKEGFGALNPIYSFYENTVANILKKQGYNPTLITDEYGNTWNEVAVKESDKKPILLRKKALQKQLTVPVTPDTQWLKDKLGMSDNEILVTKGLIEGDALGQFMDDGKILLSEFFDDATMYHEAFHRVFNMYLTEAQKEALFTELKSRNNFAETFKKFKELYGDKSDVLIMEEILAEEFSDYVLNEQEDNSILGRLFKFIKNLLGLNQSDIRQVYERINRGTYKGKPLIQEYKGSQKRLLTLGTLELDSATQDQLLSSIDQIFIQKVFLDNPFNFFDNKIDTKGIYESIIAELKPYFLEAYTTKKDARAATLYKAILDDSKGPKNLIKAHIERLKTHYKVLLIEDAVLEDDIQSRNVLDIRSSIEFDTKTTIAEVVNMMIGGLVALDRKGDVVRNSLNLPQQADVMKIKNALINNLWGLTTIEDMIDKMSSMIDKYPEFISIIDILNGGESDYQFNPEKEYLQRLRNKFTQAFAKNKYGFLLQLIESGSVYKLIDANSDQITDKIKIEWKNNFTKEHSGKSKEELISVFTDLEREISRKDLPLKDKALMLSKALGIKFTEERDAVESFSRLDQIRGLVANKISSIEDWTKVYDKENNIGLDSLAVLEAKNRDILELQIINSEGKSVYAISLNTYQSLITNEINNIIQKYPTKEGVVNKEREQVLREKLPHLFNAYTQNSLWRKKILETNQTLSIDLFDGSKEGEEGEPLQDLRETDLLATFFNSIRQGYNLSLKHSDRSMYPTYSWSDKKLPINVFKVEDAIEDAIPIFKGYIQDWKNSRDLSQGFVYYDKNKLSLGILSGIVDANELDTISDTSLENKIRKYLNSEIRKVKQLFETEKLLETYEGTPIGIPKEALEAGSFGNIDNYIGVNTINMIISHIEETKLFIGNPAFYKDANDFFKRLNVQTSTGEVFIVNEENNEYVEYLNSQDLITIDGETFQYSKFNETTKTDGTLTELVIIEDDFTSAVLNDIRNMIRKGIERETPNLSPEKVEEKTNLYLSSYAKYNENDGISIMNIFALRESMVRVGEWDTKHQNVFKEEMKFMQGLPAYQVPDGIKNSEVSDWFNNTYLPFTQQKYQYVGPNYGMPKQEYELLPDTDRLGAIALRKTSYFQLMPSNVEGTALKALMNFMLKNGVDVVHMGSAAKVGSRVQRPFFTAEGQINTAEIQPEEKGYLDFRYFKKQVEISPKEKLKIVNSTQSRKNIAEGNFNAGVPKDVTLSAEEWNALSEEKKLKLSPVYKLVKDYENLQTQLIVREISNFLTSIGAKNKIMTDESYEKLSIILAEAAEERNSPDNIKDAVTQWANDFFYIETLPNSEKIQNLLNSLITNKILVQKRLGTAMPQAPVTGFTEAIVKTDSKGKTIVEGSKYLKFYTPVYDEQGNLTAIDPAEIIMPFPVSWLNKVAGMAFSDKSYTGGRSINELVDYVNDKIERGELNFEMKGLRIPNQQLSSNDIFKVKKFSYPQYQQSVIVPSEIVAKTGGDFDIDKMQLYMYHTNPQFKPYELLTDRNSTIEQRVELLLEDPKSIKYLFPKEEKQEDVYEYFKELNKTIDTNKKELEKFLSSDIESLMLLQVRNDIQNKLRDLEGPGNKMLKESYRDLLDFVNIEIYSLASEYYQNIGIAQGTKNKLKSLVKNAIQDLPIELQNNTKTLENQILNLEKELLLNPLQAKTLLMPVADVDLKTLAKKMVKEEDRVKQWPDILSVGTKVRTYIDFVGGKAGVGQYATWVTHLVLAQLYGFKVNTQFNKQIKEDGTIEVESTQLKFEGLEDLYDLGNIYDLDKNEIASKLSELLTSQVDNVKDPYAVAMQIVSQTNNMIAYALLRQVPLKTILNFLAQPVIQEYLKAQRVNESQVIKATGRYNKESNKEGKELSKEALVEKVKSKYPDTTPKEGVITNKMMADNSYQRFMLDVFLNLQDQAVAYQRVKNYLSPDTQFPKNMADAKATIVDLKQQVEFNDILPAEFIQAAVEKGALLHGFFEGRELYYDLYKGIFLTESSLIAREFESIRRDYLTSIRGKEKKSKAASLLTQEFVNYLLQKYYLKEGDFERLMYTDSIPKRVIDFKKKYPDNMFLKEMMPIMGSSSWKIGEKTYKFDNLKSYLLKMMTDENNLLINSLEELYQKEPDFVEDLVKFNILQGGTKLGPYQLNKFMSYSLMRPALNAVLMAPVSNTDVFDFFPKFLSVYSSNVPSEWAAKFNGLYFYKNKKGVYVNKQLVQPVGEPYKWTNYMHNTGVVLDNVGVSELTQPTTPTVTPKIEVISENYSSELLKANPNKLFLFGDNNQRTGKGGQAIIRDKPNAMGISTKLLPKNTLEAFMSDNQLVENKAVIDSDIKKAKERAAKEGMTIVLPKGGFGTGLAALATKAPQTFVYLNQRLQEEFGFNNTTGEITPTVTTEVKGELFDSSLPKVNIYASTGENAELSNFAIRPFTYNGIKYNTVEGAFQAAKLDYAQKSQSFNDESVSTDDYKKGFSNLSGNLARQQGRRIKGLNTRAWDANSSRIMKELLLESFRQTPNALIKLLATGKAELTHTQDKSKWGTEFPKLLMEVRQELSKSGLTKAQENLNINNNCNGG